MCLNLLRDSTFWVFWVLEIKMVPMNINDVVSTFFFSKFSFYFQLEWGALVLLAFTSLSILMQND